MAMNSALILGLVHDSLDQTVVYFLVTFGSRTAVLE